MKEEVLNKREAVFKATLELISEQGFHATPMSQIAKRANVGVGTIYRYFTNKDDLINALYIETKTRVIKNCFHDYSENFSVQQNFKQFLRNIIQYYINNPNELSFAEQYENSTLITATTREEGLQIAKPINRIFKNAREEDLLKELSIDVLGALISGAIISLAKLYTSGTYANDGESLNKALDAIWDMIKR